MEYNHTNVIENVEYDLGHTPDLLAFLQILPTFSVKSVVWSQIVTTESSLIVLSTILCYRQIKILTWCTFYSGVRVLITNFVEMQCIFKTDMKIACVVLYEVDILMISAISE